MDTCLCVEVYLILWFWFFSLLVVTGAQLVVRVTTLTIPPLRLGLLILRSRSYNSADIATIRSTFNYQMITVLCMMCQPIKNITSFVQYNRTSLQVLFWRVVFRNRTLWRCVTAQLTSYWLLLSSHCLWLDVSFYDLRWSKSFVDIV